MPFEQYGAELLFDLETDPEERFSYVREYPGVVEDLMTKVTEMRGETAGLEKPPINPAPPEDPDVPRGPVLTPDVN